MNDRTELLCAELGWRGFTLPEDAARQTVSDHLDHVAMMMRIGRPAAKRYVTDEVIAELAARLVEGVRLTDTGTPLILVQNDEL